MSENPVHQEPPSGPRTMDLEALKALAHPLRIKLLDVLSTYGPATASGLGERLGESSGATSYHLRQLEKHSFVREIEGRGTARERWWERVPRTIQLDTTQSMESPAAMAASKIVLGEWTRNREVMLRDYVENADTLAPQWIDAGTIALASIWTTSEQLRDLSARFEAFMNAEIEKYRDQRIPGARPTQVQVNLFPVINAEEIPEEDPS
jgi:DNA-binding transcriptional ArsR family regulator